MSIQPLDFEPELLALHASLATLRSHINSIGRLEELILTLKSDPPPSGRAGELLNELDRDFLNSPKRRVFDFGSAIIALSGFAESFIENVLRAYLRALRSITEKYLDLPSTPIDRQVALSFQLVEKIEYSRFKGKLSIAAIIENLHSCTSGDVGYSVNEEAFVFHAANFRERALNEYFRQVGVENVFGLIRRLGRIKAYLKSAELGIEDEAYILNDLADLRNDVAHGVEATILSNEMLKAYIEYIEAFASSLCEVLRSEWLQRAVKQNANELGSPLTVIDNRIVCFVSIDHPIRVGDLLISRSENGHYACGPILQMQVNRIDVDEVARVTSEGVGVRVEFSPKQNQTFFYGHVDFLM